MRWAKERQFAHHAWITIWSSCKCFMTDCRRNINFHQTFYLSSRSALLFWDEGPAKTLFSLSLSRCIHSIRQILIISPRLRLRGIFIVYKHQKLHDFIQSEIAFFLLLSPPPRLLPLSGFFTFKLPIVQFLVNEKLHIKIYPYINYNCTESELHPSQTNVFTGNIVQLHQSIYASR